MIKKTVSFSHHRVVASMCTLTGRGAASSFSSALTRGNFSSKLSSSSNMSSRTMEGFKKKSREDRVSAPLQLSTVEQFYNEGPKDRQNLLAIKRFCHNEVLLYFTISGLPLIRKLKIPWFSLTFEQFSLTFH